MALTRLPLNAVNGTIAQLNTAVTDADVQSVLVSGTNIKTVGGVSVLGSGDLPVGISKYTYENRNSLRGLSPTANSSVIVDGLGLFTWEPGSAEPDDDESSFATVSGVWLLQAASWDLIDAWQSPDDAVRDEFDEDSISISPSKLLVGSANCAITSIATSNTASFTGVVVGARVGDRVVVNPPDKLGISDTATCGLNYHAWVSYPGVVTIQLNNSNSVYTGSINPAVNADWPITVIKS